MQLSAIICTHNPRSDYLIGVLDALRRQSLPGIQWELLLIDNASAVPLAPQYDLSWHPNARCVREEKLGLTNARMRGIEEARTELIVFVDDDNVLEPEYLERAAQISVEYPQLGAWGGELIGEFDEPPAPWTLPYHRSIGIRRVPVEMWAMAPLSDNPAIPYGAGMAVRSRVAKAYRTACETDAMRQSLGRTGKELLSCEDIDLALTACDCGLATGIFPRLRLRHRMPPGRLTLDYLCRIAEGTSYSFTILRYIRERVVPAPMKRTIPRRLAYLLSNRRKSPEDRAIAQSTEAGLIRGHSIAEKLMRNVGQGGNVPSAAGY